MFLSLAVVFAFVAKDLVENWGHTVARALAIGFICGCVVYQVAHRIRYGKWFEISE